MAGSPLDAYYTALDGGDAEGAAAAFAEDALYIRPSLSGDGGAPGLEVVQGRPQILEFFQRRGRKPFRHYLRTCAINGSSCFVEGVAGVDEEQPSHVFLVHATIDADGLITRYLALMAETP